MTTDQNNNTAFPNVIGQEGVKQRLLEIVSSGRLPHAIMLCGPQGAGKLAIAVDFARLLMCQNPDEKGHPCGECRNCKMARKLEHPDLHFTYPIVRGNRIKEAKDAISDEYVREWRAMLLQSPYVDIYDWLDCMKAENSQAQYYVAEADNIQHKLVLKSSQGGRKVIVLWLPEKMNAETANKLLKLLEEPPEGTVFILVSEEPELVLGTIQSRVQRINVPALSRQQQLSAKPPKDEGLFLDIYISLMRLAYQKKVKDLREWAEQCAKMGREPQKQFLQFCQRQLRDNFAYNFMEPSLNDQTEAEAAFSKNFARFINEYNVVPMMAELSRAESDIAQNVNARMVFFDLALKTITLLITPQNAK